jgi:hypothetical protein
MGLLSFARSIFQKSHTRLADSPRSGQHPSEPSSAVSTHGIQEEPDVPLPPVRIAFSDDDDFETDVVGESFRQPALSALAARIGIDKRGRRTFLASLRAEPDNAYDKNAVAVLAADTGDHLGYLSRELAPLYQRGLFQRRRRREAQSRRLPRPHGTQCDSGPAVTGETGASRSRVPRG